jgi:hypothetical protein
MTLKLPARLSTTRSATASAAAFIPGWSLAGSGSRR